MSKRDNPETLRRQQDSVYENSRC